MALRFSMLPTWWVRKGFLLTAFRGGKETGVSIAALKCVMAISTVVNFYSRKGQISYNELEDVTGLSRPMVQRGISALEEMGILKVDRGHSNEYELLIAADDSYWTKLPVARIHRELREIPNRGAVPLAGLKIYLFLLSHRKNDSLSVSTPYTVFCDMLGIQRTHVRSGLDILYSHSFLHVTPRERAGSDANLYTVLGLEKSTEQSLEAA